MSRLKQAILAAACGVVATSISSMQIPTWSGRFWLWIAVGALIIAAVTITACVVAMREAARRRKYERRIEAVFDGALDQLTSAIATAEKGQISRTGPKVGKRRPPQARPDAQRQPDGHLPPDPLGAHCRADGHA